VLSKEGMCFRGSFIMDEDIVRHALINDFPIGRNIAENLRIIDALEHHKKYGEVCPADWQKGIANI
jgi:peroxiredoxin (alkyl hydroperoxide reductase subunit C)